MKLLLTIIIATMSLTVSATKLTEADIVQLTEESQNYLLNSYFCDEVGVAEGRVDLYEEYDIQDDADIPYISAAGSMSYRCKGSTTWLPGESCEFVKVLGQSDWAVDYCDT